MSFPPVALSNAETVAASIIRGLEGVSADWGELIAASQKVIGAAQELISAPAFDVADLYSDAGWPVTAAARILNAGSIFVSDTQHEASTSLSILSASAFG